MTGRPMTAEDLLALRWIQDVAISPDGQTVAYTLEVIAARAADGGGAHEYSSHEYRSHLWLAGTDGSPPRQFTVGEHRDRRPVWSPDGTRLLFVSDRGTPAPHGGTPAPHGGTPARHGGAQARHGGSRPKHLWVIPTTGGEAQRITQDDHTPTEAAWSPDGTQVAFIGKVPRAETPPDEVKIITRLRHKLDGEGFWDNRYTHAFVVPSAGGPARQLTTGDFDHREVAWSPDGTRLAVVANRSPDADLTNVADVWVLTLATGDLRCVTAGAGPVAAPTWSPDGSMLAYLGHDNACMAASNTMLWVVPADGGAPPRCLTRHYDRSLAHHLLSDMRSHPRAGRPTWSPDGRFVFVMAAEGGTTQLAAVEVATGAVRLMTTGRREIYGESYDAACRRVALAVSDPITPGDIWIGEIEGLAEGSPSVPPARERRLTAVNQALLDEVALSTPQRFAYRGADDWTIEGWVIPPVGHDPSRRSPAILSVHGGPHAAFGETFFHEFQMLAGMGYAVVLTNPRGSQGYGQAFTAATHHDWGGRDYQDIMAGLDAALARFPSIDPERLGVQGGSYGGYMTNWIIGHTRRFKAAVTMRSIANCTSQWGTSDLAYFKGFWEFPGDPWDSPTFYWERSPLAYVRDITTPLLIEHSEDDLRCPIGEAEQLFAALKKLGREVVFVRYPDESHDLSRSGRPDRRVRRLRLIAEWFAKHIPAEVSAGTARA